MRVRLLASAAIASACLCAALATGGCGAILQPAATTPAKPTPPLASEVGGGSMSLGFTTDAFLPAEPGAPASSGAKSAIPAKYAMKGVAGGENVSIPYAWGLASTRTKSFALTLVDRHPMAGNWVHWMVIDIPASVTCLPEGVSGSTRVPAGTRELKNSFGTVGYGGPQPPARSGPHDYVATLYALDVPSLDLSADATLAQFERAVAQHTVGSETCRGWFAP